MKSRVPIVLALLALVATHSTTTKADANISYLLKFRSPMTAASFAQDREGSLERVSAESGLYKWSVAKKLDLAHWQDPRVTHIERNHVIRLLRNPSLENQKAKVQAYLKNHLLAQDPAYPDNPAIAPLPSESTAGGDPLLQKAWGIFKIGADKGWGQTPQGESIIVAVTDTGVDYNHPDLIVNMWRNPGEVPDDGIDNDNNGFIDDVVGYDFASNDARPYDLSMSLMDILLKNGNAGHGTHVSGVISAALNNALGTAGVAPKAKIMACRFINETGKGETSGAVKAIDYAVANGATIINASWGSEGEEEGDLALREAVQRAEAKGVLFVASAGNGRLVEGKAQGYDNDNDAKPMFPASYPYGNIVAVAAVDDKDRLASFSNFGKNTVHVAAPGVKILSTVPGNRYQDTIVDLGSIKVTWDGTSMASPFVAGSLAMIWSQTKHSGWQEIRKALLDHAAATPNLSGKVSTGGRLDLAGFLH